MLAEVTTDSASILFCEHLVPCDTPSAWCAPACCKRTQRAAEAIMGNRQGQWEVHTAESQGEQEVQVLEGLLEPRPRARPRGCDSTVNNGVRGEADPVREAKRFSRAFRTDCFCRWRQPVTMLTYFGLYLLPVLQL